MGRIFYGKYDDEYNKAYIFHLKNGDEIRILGAKAIPSDVNFLFVEIKLTETHSLNIKKDELIFVEEMSVDEYIDEYENIKFKVGD